MRLILKLFLMLLPCLPCMAQQPADPLPATQPDSGLAIPDLPDHLFERIAARQRKTADAINRQNGRLLRKLQAKERKVFKQLERLDSGKARELFAGIPEKYGRLRQKAAAVKVHAGTNLCGVATVHAADGRGGQYIPRMDSLSSMLKFLQAKIPPLGSGGAALAQVDGLKARLAEAGDIKSLAAEREQALANMLAQWKAKGLDGIKGKLPLGKLEATIGQYGKQVYYYKERLAGIKESLKDPEKLEKEALAVLNKLPVFQQFMREHGELAQLFGPSAGTPATGGNPLAGLQTRASVTQLLQQQLGAAGVNPQQYIQQQLGAAQAQLANLKAKAENLKSGNLGNGGGDEMPGFKPNSQKAKPFLKRLEYGWNLQTGNRAAYSFPSSNDLGASLGYKWADRLSLGFGAAYKFGLGSAWNKVAFSSDGVGFRSYIDFKLSSPQKVRALFSNLWLSGGYERNYWSKFKSIPELRKLAWQTSGLLGISKKIQYKKKEARMSVLYDFLKKRLPGESPVIWRVGYSL